MAPNLPSNPKGLSSTTPDGLVAPPAAKVQKTEGFSVMAEAKPEHYHAGNKLTILVDMDNTLCDWEGAFEACMKAKFPEVALVPAEGRLNWDISKDYPAAAADKVKAVSGTPGFFSEMKAVEGGVEAVKAMAAAGHNVLLVTAPDPNFYTQCSQEKYEWVEKNLGAEWKAKVVLTRDKTTVRGDFLIDDKPHCDVGALEPEWAHVVFDQTYNRQKGGKRLSSWAAWKDVLGVKAELDCAVSRNPRASQENLYPNGINFSCVFPSFNQESIVRKTLAGLVKQKIKSNFKFEVVIVDNNSTDDIDAIYKK
mmetsp:Transcript_9932/g.20072  ORF Transcript_9932/g.20072 Transcript_9932/m.20072 type:complete len:308 (+) Transcript_9932:270-1193(+)